MTAQISDAVLSRLNDFVACHLGLHFPRERWPDLQRAVCGAAQECGWQHDLDRYVQGLLSPALQQNHLELLASHLTVGETYFFREKRSLEILEERIVPELIRARAGLSTPIRIWSAGCATGEEPYSVAIVLNKLLAGLKDRNVEILATDLNTKSLQKASAGTYGDWSFRDTPRWVRHTYFEAGEDGRSTIVPAIKKMVRFAPLNLMDDAYLPLANWTNGFDVIFCRNVLMYFTPEGMRKVIGQLYRSLATDGWLIVSATETSHELFSEFATVSFGDATFYRKSATSLPTKFCVPVFDESRSDESRSAVQLPEWMMRAPEPARISCDEIRPESPDDAGSKRAAPPAISYRQALALYEQGRYEDMEQMIVARPSEDMAPEDMDPENMGPEDMDRASAMLLLARAHANQGKLPEALGWCDRAIAANKMAAPAHYLRATILQEQGALREAVLALKQAVYVDPRFVLGHWSLGNLAQKQGRRQESEKHFENALLLLARYEPDDIVPESEGLSGVRLREMILSANQGIAAAQTGQPRIRVRQQVGNIALSSKK